MSQFESCIYCRETLSKWEKIRSYCWNCSELTTDTYQEEEEVERNSGGIEKG